MEQNTKKLDTNVEPKNVAIITDEPKEWPLKNQICNPEKPEGYNYIVWSRTFKIKEMKPLIGELESICERLGKFHTLFVASKVSPGTCDMLSEKYKVKVVRLIFSNESTLFGGEIDGQLNFDLFMKTVTNIATNKAVEVISFLESYYKAICFSFCDAFADIPFTYLADLLRHLGMMNVATVNLESLKLIQDNMSILMKSTEPNPFCAVARDLFCMVRMLERKVNKELGNEETPPPTLSKV